MLMLAAAFIPERISTPHPYEAISLAPSCYSEKHNNAKHDSSIPLFP